MTNTAKNYSGLLPRKIPNTTMLCQHLNMDGGRCLNRATREVTYHGDNETYRGWACICICERHYKKYKDFAFEED